MEGGLGADGQADALKATHCQRPSWAPNLSCVPPRASPHFVCGSQAPAAQPACELWVSSSLPPTLVFCKKVGGGGR